jgi:hypothetical protein
MPQKAEMFLAPGDNLVEVIAPGDCGARHQQQDLAQRIDDTPGLAVIIEFGKWCKSRANRARGISLSKIESKIIAMVASLPNHRRPRNHNPRVNTKLRPKAR